MNNKIILDYLQTCNNVYKKKTNHFHEYYENNGGLQVYIIRDLNTHTIVVVFSGTNETKDWVSNLNIIPYNLGQGKKVHFGYWILLHMQNVHQKVISSILHNIEEYPNIVFTGHSMVASFSVNGL